MGRLTLAACVVLLVVPAWAYGQAAQIAPALSDEEIEPRTIGTTGATLIGIGGYVDRVFSTDSVMPMQLTLHADVSHFISHRLVVRGGLNGSGSVGGADDDVPAGTGAAAIHLLAGLHYYFTPQSILSAYAGGDYWLQVTRRVPPDTGALVGIGGLHGAISSRASVFIEGGYGFGLSTDDDSGRPFRAVGRIGIRLKL